MCRTAYCGFLQVYDSQYKTFWQALCQTHRSNDVRDVRHCSARSSSQVHDLCSGLYVDLVYSSQDGCCQLGAERVPGSVFDFSFSLLTEQSQKTERLNVTVRPQQLISQENTKRLKFLYNQTDTEISPPHSSASLRTQTLQWPCSWSPEHPPSLCRWTHLSKHTEHMLNHEVMTA